MEPLLRFKKIKDKQNILCDEFFHEASKIDIISFNYNNEGSALCRCDGKLRKLSKNRINKILFGVELARLDTFIKGIYQPDTKSKDLKRKNGKVQFRMEELKSLDKYSVGNLAKKIHKELLQQEIGHISYFQEQKINPAKKSKSKKSAPSPAEQAYFGNKNTHVFHLRTCNNYNSSTCTAVFNSLKEAKKAGFRPCKLCSSE